MYGSLVKCIILKCNEKNANTKKYEDYKISFYDIHTVVSAWNFKLISRTNH